ncbi:MAG TPA: hypothetical protein VIK55_02735 [Paludibacter sp.]
MKKTILIVICILSFIVILILGIYMYIVFGYAKGELDDSKRIFNNEKNYMLNLSFEGKTQKKINESLYDKSHRYSVKIILYKINPKPSFCERQYPTFYDLKNDSVLYLSVSQSFFNQIEVNQEVNKNVKDYYIEVNGKKLLLLSKDKDKWLP